MREMNELRRLQKVSSGTLTISIPTEYVHNLKLKQGDNVLVEEGIDGTLTLAPVGSKPKTVKATIKVDAVDSPELLSKIVVGCYMLGYDSIELTSKRGMSKDYLGKAAETLRGLRGLEIVQSSQSGLLAQSFMDPSKFPVDSLIKRLQLLVSRSLENAVEALRKGNPATLQETRRIQKEIDELYWLIVRQLLGAFRNREVSVKIGLESPLHASGDRVSAKTIDEIGRIILELSEEIISFRESGIRVEGKATDRIEELAKSASESFEATIEGLLAPDIRTIERALGRIESSLNLEREMTLEFSGPEQYRVMKITSDLGQLIRYCNIIIEIAFNRLLRKTSSVCVIQEQ